MSEYGLEKEGRVHVDYTEIALAFNSKDPERIKKIKQYCKDDAEDLIVLHRYICQADFYLTQICPMNYQRLVYSGSAGRINTIILRSYIKENVSVPLWNTDISTTIQGAQVEANESGVFKYVGDMDVRSMYPTLMILYDIFPESDSLEIMKNTLIDLRDMRYIIKDKLKLLEYNSKEYKFIKGQDLAYKGLINSYFGVLGSAGFHWKDEKKCAEVTRKGRELITLMRDRIVSDGFQVIALDTDGIAFTKNDEYDIKDVENSVIEILPEGVEVETAKYKAMVVFKKKSYAILKNDDTILCKGAAVTSTSFPECIRKFIFTMIKLLFAIKFDEDSIESLKMRVCSFLSVCLIMPFIIASAFPLASASLYKNSQYLRPDT
jgi:DNA polymerase I